MAHSYPIWHNVEACIYKTSKAYGAKDTSKDEILVGSSPKNSHTLGTVVTTRRFTSNEVDGKVCVFKLSVDTVIVKEIVFKDNKGKAGEFIREVSYL